MTRSFSFRTAGLLLLGACLSLPLSAKESAEGFSRQVALSLQGEGPWYRLSIPMSVQLSAAHADLRDLRVFDAEGEALPYALMAGSERQASTSHEAEVRLFPLRGTSAADATQPNLRVQRNTSGTIVEVLPGNAGPAAETLRGWLIDASAVTFPWSACGWTGAARRRASSASPWKPATTSSIGRPGVTDRSPA